jgi:hypothetical protein
LQVSLPGYGVCLTNSTGSFGFSQVVSGKHKLSLFQSSKVIYSTDVEVISNKIITLKITLKSPEAIKKDLPDFSVVDISKESSWDYWVVGKEEYFYIDVENSLPKSVFYHSFKKGKDYGITFDSKGLPSKVITDNFVFLFDNFNGNKVDLGIISPSGDIQMIREVKTDFVWPTSSKSLQSKADIIRWTGRILKAIPCVTSGVTALVSGGAAIPLALWTCGNYFLNMADSFFDDADVKNGFTRFVSDYKLTSTVYICTSGVDPSSCLLSLAFKGWDLYADYVEEMEKREYYITKLEGMLSNKIPLKNIIIQPGPEGKDAGISLSGFSSPCREFYHSSANDSIADVDYDLWESCSKKISRMLLQFPLEKVPVNAVISSARLEVYGWATINYVNQIPTISLSKLNNSWNEANVSWINQPETKFISSTDFIHEGENAWYSWDVASIVQDWVSGKENNFGFQISTSEKSVSSEIYSGDHFDVNKRPKLVISYY